jgi:PKHD-type hydroxylase
MIACIDDVLEAEELKKVRTAVAGMTFADGKATAGYRAQRVKNNLQVDREKSPQATEMGELVRNGLRRNAEFRRVALPRVVRQPMFSMYKSGMEYGRHVDDALMGTQPRIRSDLSVTVFLNSPAEYDGGELVIESPFGEQAVKLPAGAAVVYPSSTLHRVTPITRGERLAAVTWVQSFVRDPSQRELLHDLDTVRHSMARLAPEAPETDLAFKCYVNLMRLWTEV